MKAYTPKGSGLKFYYFLSVFFGPVLFVIEVLTGADIIINSRDNIIGAVLTLLVAVWALISTLALRKYKSFSITAVILTVVFMILESISAFQNLENPGLTDETYSVISVILVRFCFAAYTIVYMIKHRGLFVKSETDSAPVETMDTDVAEPKKTSDLILAPIVTILAFCLIFEWSGRLLSLITGLISPLNKLLTYPYPGTIPWENPYSAVSIGLEFVLAFIACRATYKAGIFTPADQSMDKKSPKAIPLLLGCVSGTQLVLLISIFQIVVFGSSFIVNKMFPRVIFTIFTGFFYYLFVGMFEELVMRGMLMKFYVKRGKIVLGILISNLTFVGIHFITGAYDEWRAFVFLFFAGLLLSVVYLYTDNLWLAIGLHFGYDWAIDNLIEMRFLVSKNSFFSLTKLYKWNTTTSISVMCFVFTVVLFILYMQKKKRARVQ